jgi:predicted nucleic acid-binding protein
VTFVAAPTPIVIDASVAIEMLLGDEAWAGRWEQWLLSGALLLAPQHLGLEVANGLLAGRREKAAVVTERLDALYRTGLEETTRGPIGLRQSIGLAERHGLTVYDAAYLDLAIDVDGELATLDRALAKAAAAEGVSVIA